MHLAPDRCYSSGYSFVYAAAVERYVEKVRREILHRRRVCQIPKLSRNKSGELASKQMLALRAFSKSIPGRTSDY